jgi:hypothetical protein
VSKWAASMCLCAACLFWAVCANANGGSPGWHAFENSPGRAVNRSARNSYLFKHRPTIPHKH